MDTCQKMENSSAQALTRIQSLQTAAHGAYNLSVKQAPAAEGIITTLTSYNTSAYAVCMQFFIKQSNKYILRKMRKLIMPIVVT